MMHDMHYYSRRPALHAASLACSSSSSSCQRFWNKMMEQSGGDWTGRDLSIGNSSGEQEEKDESASMQRCRHLNVDAECRTFATSRTKAVFIAHELEFENGVLNQCFPMGVFTAYELTEHQPS